VVGSSHGLFQGSGLAFMRRDEENHDKAVRMVCVPTKT
jgi:hypothetical protein